MIKEFIQKLNNNEYISTYLYEYVLNNDSSIIPSSFDIDKYNNVILDKMYNDNKEYFENMYKGIDDNIHLDEEQCKAILADEKYSLIIAGAGTGKTTTMVSKVKYLVDKKNADPRKILVMSYTRKATEEIIDRIEENFNLPVNVTTFHSLGYRYIKEIFYNRKCIIMDRNKRNEIFLDYFRKIFADKSKIQEILSTFDIIKEKRGFVFSKYFLENYMNYETYDKFVDAYVLKKLKEAKEIGIDNLIEKWIEREKLKDAGIRTIKGEIVKSAGEMIIANFLYINGIDYTYEQTYDELMDNNSIYKPDFTIDYGGEKIYVEYFGLDDKEYNKIKKWKQTFHDNRGNKFISIDKLPLDRIVSELDWNLKKIGIRYNQQLSEVIYEHILRQNPLSQVFPFIEFLYDCLLCRKESFYRDNTEIVKQYLNDYDNSDLNILRIQHKYIEEFYNFYSKCCYGGAVYYFDFSDLLYYSVKYLEKLTSDTNLVFDYIIVDEYQDISQLKYQLTYKTATRNNAKVYAVGDDWQSIYAFSGSRIEYIYRFKEYFKGAKNFNISKTYRNSQELIDCSGEFIMKNKDQIVKQLVSDKHINTPIEFREFNSESDSMAEIECLKKTILEIHSKNPEHKILVLGRTNSVVDKILEDKDLIDGIGTKILFKGNEDIEIDGMTMHKSKGLTYDEVILLGLNQKFPSSKEELYWYKSLYINKNIKESVPFAEERRVFYVALTRTKNKVYLLCDKHVKNRSSFIKEIEDIVKNNNL